ncbi:MAG TPA: hypothetical protein VFR15_11065 [Chloroflexia bacterium]|nr:hypothetical protein [Chloroflexia bacterium]
MSTQRAAAALLNPGVYFGVLLMAVLSVAAYQVRPSYDVAPGVPYDRGLISGFHDAEFTPPDAGLPYTRFRWSAGNASYIYFDGVGHQDFDAVVMVNGSRPEGAPPATMRLRAGDTVLLDTTVPPGISEHRFRVPREAVTGGSVALRMDTNSFTVPGDRRELGIILLRVRLDPGAGSDLFVEPHAGTIAALAGAVGLLCLLLAFMSWGAGTVGLAGALLSLLASGLLAFDRLWLTQRGWPWAWAQALLVGAVVAALCWWVGGWLIAAGGVPWSPAVRRALVTLVLVVFAVRLAGQLHPGIFVYDLGFHANILAMVERGQLLFTTQPAEFGGTGHSTFYLPTASLFIAPLHWLMGDDRLAIRIFTVAAGTLGALPVFYVASRVMRSVRAGLFSAALYLIFPISVIIFSWGITTNIFGEFLALCALAVFVGSGPHLTPRRPAFWALSVLAMLTLLSHPGVLVLFSVALIGACLAMLLWARSEEGRRHSLRGLSAYALAGVAAFVVYFRNFVPELAASLVRITGERGSEGVVHVVGGSVEDPGIGLFQREVDNFADWLLWGLRGFWGEFQAYYRVWPVVAAALGVWLVRLVARRRRQDFRRRALLAAVAGWAFAVALLALAGWTANLFVRYMLFALPIVALGSGVLLASLTTRGRWGLPLSVLVAVFFAFEALVFWQYRIDYAFK